MKFSCNLVLAGLLSVAVPTASLANCYVPAMGKKDGDRFVTEVFETSEGTVFAVDMAPFYDTNTPANDITQYARIEELNSLCFEDKLALRVNNASVRVTILQPGPDNSTISFNVCDYGGHENGSARRVDPHDFRDDLRNFDGYRFQDDNGNDVVGEVRGGGREMKVAYRGREPLKTAVMGGQELFINSICVD